MIKSPEIPNYVLDIEPTKIWFHLNQNSPKYAEMKKFINDMGDKFGNVGSGGQHTFIFYVSQIIKTINRNEETVKYVSETFELMFGGNNPSVSVSFGIKMPMSVARDVMVDVEAVLKAHGLNYNVITFREEKGDE